MKKIIILLLLTLSFASCSDNNKSSQDKLPVENKKSPTELENESIASGIIDDSLIFDCYFGMSRSDYEKQINDFVNKKLIQINADSSILSYTETPKMGIYRNTTFEFYNNKLFRTRTYYLPNQTVKKGKLSFDVESELIDKIKLDNNLKETLKNGNQPSKYYWLSGNKRIDLYDTLDLFIQITSDMRIERLIEEDTEKKATELAKQQKIEDSRIEQKIKEIAKRDWPDDYTTQEYWIKEQLAAYEYMKLVPDDNIKRKAQRDWPYDFSTQKYWYNEQIAAKDRIK